MWKLVSIENQKYIGYFFEHRHALHICKILNEIMGITAFRVERTEEKEHAG